jgi:hypothetical protein
MFWDRPTFWSSHELAKQLLDLPDRDVYLEVETERYVRAWEAPTARVVSYLYNDETDEVIVIKGDPDW